MREVKKKEMTRRERKETRWLTPTDRQRWTKTNRPARRQKGLEEVERGRTVERKHRGEVKLGWKRRTGSGRKERGRSGVDSESRESADRSVLEVRWERTGKREDREWRKTRGKRSQGEVKNQRKRRRNPEDRIPLPEIQEWTEQVVRVGTGYRVRKDEEDPKKRRFDVGYADRKTYNRKEGREAIIEKSNMGRTVIGKGPDARVKVRNAVCAMEKRRRVSEYTGSGIRRKSEVGKQKLKPTKPQAKA